MAVVVIACVGFVVVSVNEGRGAVVSEYSSSDSVTTVPVGAKVAMVVVVIFSVASVSVSSAENAISPSNETSVISSLVTIVPSAVISFLSDTISVSLLSGITATSPATANGSSQPERVVTVASVKASPFA